VADIVQIRDFAADEAAPQFYVGPENHFTCVPDIPLSLMQQVAKFSSLKDQVMANGDMEPLLGLFDELLMPDSAHLFRQRVSDKTIGIRRIMKIIPYILEEYGLGHPTQPSLDSSSGSSDGETGATSPAGLTPRALTLGGSQPA
jgi:hypothetical protein